MKIVYNVMQMRNQFVVLMDVRNELDSINSMEIGHFAKIGDALELAQKLADADVEILLRDLRSKRD